MYPLFMKKNQHQAPSNGLEILSTLLTDPENQKELENCVFPL